jgi:hypothetical protein
MSVQDRPKRLSVTQIRNRKGGDKLVCLTAYTSSVARLLDNVVDLLLVGDSLAMTVYGFDSTLSIGLDTMSLMVPPWCARPNAPWSSSICRSAAIRPRPLTPFAAPRGFSPRQVAPQ